MTLGRFGRTLALLALGTLAWGGHAHRKVRPKPRPRAAKLRRQDRPPSQVPIVNVQALAPFLEALEHTPAIRSVRILQFGDSHTAADYWTGRMRQRLQARFGDGGPGLILPGRPWRGYHHEGVNLQEGLHWPADSLRSKACEGWVGLTGAAIQPPAEGGTFTLVAAYQEARIQVLGPGKPVVLGATIEPILEQPVGERVLQVFKAPGYGLETLAFQLPQGSSLLGVDLRSGRPGLVYDELGLNGAEFLDLERWRPELRRSLLAQLQPDLLVLAYGTNDMGRTDISPEDYQERARGLMAVLKQESGACVLVVGPLDRMGRNRRQLPRLREGARWVTKALRSAALASGCAFWDARQAMGGEGSLLGWKRRGLAQKDLVHLTGPGYEKLGDLLVEALLRESRSGK
ncbi:MAG: hypothetical protein H6Q00_421 [Holophagaceae bacterium]|nr:hypothetical protein [Holophagaceae bacterium]